MKLVFVLVVLLNGKPIQEESHWEDLDRCLLFAMKLRTQHVADQRHGELHKSPVETYCLPKRVDPTIIEVYT
jgi:hypothetical protein